MPADAPESDTLSAVGNANNANLEYNHLYPGRKGDEKSYSWFSKLFLKEKRENIDRTQCEINVYNCVQNSPIVKLMLAALKNSGCEVDISRHISCEVCDNAVTGGFDPDLNQVIICQNTSRTRGRVQSTLAHEMIHMFDYCRNKLDLKNLDHLACTEIRAANICHCSFLGAYARKAASFTHIKEAHKDCVIEKAVRSIRAIQNISEDEAGAAVMRVFDRCYNDLEPVGRRIRRKSDDMKRAYLEAPLYGYSD